MLALSRKKNEALIINNNIEITVLEIKGEQVKLGISAPKDVPIYRKEVYVQIQEANKEAVNMDGLEALRGLLGQKDSKQIMTGKKPTEKPWVFLEDADGKDKRDYSYL